MTSKPVVANNFKADVLRTSALRPYSYGVVAENKVVGSLYVEVIPSEELFMLDGDMTSAVKTTNVLVKSTNGETSVDLKSTNSIRAKWLPYGSSNRITAPDVRRGELVMIYQVGDSGTYFWTTMSDDISLRRLETVIYSFSAEPNNETKELTGENTYFLMVSTHLKKIWLHTSTENDEAVGYDIEINTGSGIFSFVDTVGNSIQLDSTSASYTVENSSGNTYSMVGDDVTQTCKGIHTVNATQYIVNSDLLTLNASEIATIKTSSATVIADDTRVVSGNIDLVGSVSVQGPLSASGALAGGGVTMADGNISAPGNITAAGVVSAQNI